MGIDPRQLASFWDGELEGTRAAAVARELCTDRVARGMLNEWASVGKAVRMWADAQPSPRPEAVELILSRIEREARPGDCEVVRATRGKWWSKLGRGQGRSTYAGYGWPLLAAASAFAAAWLVVATLYRDPPRELGSVEPVVAPGLAVVGRSAVRPLTDGGGASLLALDSGEHQVAVFFVAADGGSTPVVWLLDDPPVRSERTQPL